MSAVQIRVGVPLPGGQLVAAARARKYPVLFSANAFAKTYAAGHERQGFFKGFRYPDPTQFAGLDAALDSAGFVAASRYGDFRWTLEDYLDLVQSHSWSWWAAMDYCVEPEISSDRPLRLLRIAATASMLGRCRSAARERGLQDPMPILQGWTPDEYVTCAKWLPLVEWPALVGVGSVCRREVHGPTGILAILAAVDAVLPVHTKLHLFGVKSAALQLIAHHPRVASVDSMAWDVQARTERRTSRDMQFRIGHMERWTERQLKIARRPPFGAGVQTLLFDPTEFGGLSDLESKALEALAMRLADLVLSGDIDYRDAVGYAMTDGFHVIAILRTHGLSAEGMAELDAVVSGLADDVRDAVAA